MTTKRGHAEAMLCKGVPTLAVPVYLARVRWNGRPVIEAPGPLYYVCDRCAQIVSVVAT